MKQILIFLINFYQITISSFLKNILGVNKLCRFEITCSEYSKKAIMKEGAVKGSYKLMIRLLKCQPYFNF